MRKLEGKTAYVTGGGRGIGREVVLKLAQDGANVVVNDLDADVAHAVADEARSCGVRALAVPGSVSDGDFGDRFVGAGVEAFGGIDIVVNNAGYTWDSMINKMSDAQFDAMLDVHLKAPFRILRAASQFKRRLIERPAERTRQRPGGWRRRKLSQMLAFPVWPQTS